MVSYDGCLCLLKACRGSENGDHFYMAEMMRLGHLRLLVYDEKLGLSECLKDVEICEHRA